MANLKVKLTKSLIGCLDKQILTAHALGLRRIGQETVQPDNEATRGKIKVIAHLVDVSQA